MDELAVNERAPASEPPMHTPIALCSDSTATTRPLVNLKSRRNSTISVCGVMGYAPQIAPRALRLASPASASVYPAALFPVTSSRAT